MADSQKTECVYSKVEFFISDNIERYRDYALLNPDMTEDEVVWRVNSNLDKEKYCFDVLVSECDDICVIVNKFFKLPEDYIPCELVEVDGCIMRRVTADAYVMMRDKARSEGYSVTVSSAYRSIADQKDIYTRFLSDPEIEDVDKRCARPCYSEHHTGLAIDVQGRIPGGHNIHKTPEAAWVRDNCYKFGFILRYLPETTEITGYDSEPWHLRYVGTEISNDMYQKNIKSYEEYYERFLRTGQ